MSMNHQNAAAHRKRVRVRSRQRTASEICSNAGPPESCAKGNTSPKDNTLSGSRFSQRLGQPILLQALLTSKSAPSSAQQVKDKYDQRDHQQEVNEAAADVKAEAQKPQNHKDYKD